MNDKVNYTDVAKTGLAAMAPASSGWILAVVVIIITIQVSDYFASIRLADYLSQHNTSNKELMTNYIEHNAEQDRRYQETIKELVETIIRENERLSRAEAENYDN